MLHGSCLCGDVAWEAASPPQFMSHCHCSMCRKMHGTAFGTYVGTAAEGFRWTRGDGGITRFVSSPGGGRRFCSRCGSPLPVGPAEGNMFLPAGGLDDDPGVRPMVHIFVASKAPWYDLADSLPRFDAFPPGVGQAVERPAPPSVPAGRARGSCLCDTVTWEVDGAPARMANCHCARCRKARGAAHATNAFWPLGAFRWLSGEAAVRRYRVPEAQYFANCFCGTCGAKTPRLDPSRDLAVVPAGALDHDPGLRPQMHIFVASKAPWYEISDDLPRHHGAPASAASR